MKNSQSPTNYDRGNIKAYIENLCHSLKVTANSAESPLCRRGVYKNVLYKHRAGLYDGKPPLAVTEILNQKAYQEERSCILMYYSKFGLPTHLVLSRGGFFEKYQLSNREGIFLESNIREESVVFADEVDALIGSYEYLPGICVSSPTALTSSETNIVLVDSPEKPLSIPDALEYYKLFSEVKIVTLSESVASLRQMGLRHEISRHRVRFFEWIVKVLPERYTVGSGYLAEDLEEHGMPNDIRDEIISHLTEAGVTPFMIEWFKSLALDVRTVNVAGYQVTQSKAGWKVSGDDEIISNFQLIIRKCRTVGKVRMAECEILVYDGTRYTMDVLLSKLNTRKSIDGLIHSSFKEMGFAPDVDSIDIKHPNLTWLKIAGKFSPFENVKNTLSLGYDDLSLMLEDIYRYTEYTRPATASQFNYNRFKLGYFHHLTGNLILVKSRLVKALIALTGKNYTLRDLDSSLEGRVVHSRYKGMPTYVLSEQMVRENKIIPFKLA